LVNIMITRFDYLSNHVNVPNITFLGTIVGVKFVMSLDEFIFRYAIVFPQPYSSHRFHRHSSWQTHPVNSLIIGKPYH
jgi:hypothetical protein